MIKKCKRIYLLNQIFFPDSFLVIIEVLFFLEYFKLIFLQFSSIISVSILVSTIFEIPSGIISDKYGRKKILIIGNLIDISGVFFLIFFVTFYKSSFTLVVIIECIRALGRTLASGNFDILIFEMYKNSKVEEIDLKKDTTTFFSVGVLLSSIFAYTSTYLYSLFLLLPLLVDTLIKIIKLISYFFLEDRFKYKSLKINEYKEKFFLNKNLRKIVDKDYSNIIKTIFIFSLIFVISRVTFSLYQPIFQEAGISLKYYGITIFFLNFSLFLITFSKKEFLSKLSEKKSIKIIVTILMAQILIYFINFSINLIFRYFLIFIMLTGMQIIRIIAEGLSKYFINQSLEKIDNKSFFFSLYYTVISILFSISFQSLGIIQDNLKSFINAYIVICLFFSILVYILFLFKNKR